MVYTHPFLEGTFLDSYIETLTFGEIGVLFNSFVAVNLIKLMQLLCFIMEQYNPANRLETLYKHAKDAVKTDHDIAAIRYYRSGNEMVRMANVYLSEGNFEQAYVLYQRYLW